MTEILALLGLLTLLALAVPLWRLVARDGHGSRPTPRSHREELGGWATQQLQR